ncbi:MAG TPA: SRPBCC domain-containing protein [Stellaceae bacterium]|nr:SRPBCC domain-containing protein [Stellaceae bacterium]
MPEIMHLVKIRSPQDKVYKAVSTAEGIRNWWTHDAALDPNVGGTGEFGFYGHRMVVKVKVAELTPPRHVAWDAVSSTGGGFDGTTITFDLKSEEGVTTLLFAHRGFEVGGDNIASATTRWGFYLLSLKRYLETGNGTPNPEDTELIR